MTDPNRELDVWLAERLFGIKAWESAGSLLYWTKDGAGPCTNLPHFSSTYDGMGLVIEKMRERGFDLTIHIAANPGTSSFGVVCTDPSGNDVSTEFGDSCYLAVGLAARAALESTEKQNG
jgi:hypothetical protein